MTTQTIAIGNVDQSGLVADTPSVKLPIEAFSDVNNVRFDDGAIRKIKGHTEVLADHGISGDIIYSALWPNPNTTYYVIVVNDTDAQHKVYTLTADASDGSAKLINRTPVGGLDSDATRYQHTLFLGGYSFILNNGYQTPIAISDVQTGGQLADNIRFTPLAGWDSYNVDNVLFEEEFAVGNEQTTLNIFPQLETIGTLVATVDEVITTITSANIDVEVDTEELFNNTLDEAQTKFVLGSQFDSGDQDNIRAFLDDVASTDFTIADTEADDPPRNIGAIATVIDEDTATYTIDVNMLSADEIANETEVTLTTSDDVEVTIAPNNYVTSAIVTNGTNLTRFVITVTAQTLAGTLRVVHTDTTTKTAVTFTSEQAIGVTVRIELPIFRPATQVTFGSGQAGNIIITKDIPNSIIRANVIQSFGNLLMAGGLTEFDENNEFIRNLGGIVRSSNVASAGKLPTNWNPFVVGAGTAEELTLAETGTITAMSPLKDAMYVYTSDSIHRVAISNNPNLPLSASQISNTYGALSQSSVLEFEGQHIVVGSNDIYSFGGNPGTIKSIADNKVRKFLFDSINPNTSDNLFILRNQLFDEIWVCYPDVSALTRYSNTALIYNYTSAVWTKRDLPDVSAGFTGPVPGGGSPKTTITLQTLTSGDSGALNLGRKEIQTITIPDTLQGIHAGTQSVFDITPVTSDNSFTANQTELIDITFTADDSSSPDDETPFGSGPNLRRHVNTLTINSGGSYEPTYSSGGGIIVLGWPEASVKANLGTGVTIPLSGLFSGAASTKTATEIATAIVTYINNDEVGALADFTASSVGTVVKFTSDPEVFGDRSFSSASQSLIDGALATITGTGTSNDDNLGFVINGSTLKITNNRTLALNPLAVEVTNLGGTVTAVQSIDIDSGTGVGFSGNIAPNFSQAGNIHLPSSTYVAPPSPVAVNSLGSPAQSALNAGGRFLELVSGGVGAAKVSVSTFPIGLQGTFQVIISGVTYTTNDISVNGVGTEYIWTIGNSGWRIYGRTSNGGYAYLSRASGTNSLSSIRLNDISPNKTITYSGLPLTNNGDSTTITATADTHLTIDSISANTWTAQVNSVSTNSPLTAPLTGSGSASSGVPGGVQGLSITVTSDGASFDSDFHSPQPGQQANMSLNGIGLVFSNTGTQAFTDLMGGIGLTNMNEHFRLEIRDAFGEDNPAGGGLVVGPGGGGQPTYSYRPTRSDNGQPGGLFTKTAANSLPTSDVTVGGIRTITWANAGSDPRIGGNYTITMGSNGTFVYMRVSHSGDTRYNIPSAITVNQSLTGKTLTINNDNANSVVLTSGTWGAVTIASGDSESVNRNSSTDESWVIAGTYSTIIGDTTVQTAPTFADSEVGNGVLGISTADSPAISVTFSGGGLVEDETIVLAKNITSTTDLRDDIIAKLILLDQFSGLDPIDPNANQPDDAVFFVEAEGNAVRLESVLANNQASLSLSYNTVDNGSTEHSENTFGGNITNSIEVGQEGGGGLDAPILRLAQDGETHADIILFGVQTQASIAQAILDASVTSGEWVQINPVSNGTFRVRRNAITLANNIDSRNTLPDVSVVSDADNLITLSDPQSVLVTEAILGLDNGTTLRLTSPEGAFYDHQFLDVSDAIPKSTIANAMTDAVTGNTQWDLDVDTDTDTIVFTDAQRRDNTEIDSAYASVPGKWVLQVLDYGDVGNAPDSDDPDINQFDSETEAVVNTTGISVKRATPTSFDVVFQVGEGVSEVQTITMGTSDQAGSLDQSGALSAIETAIETSTFKDKVTVTNNSTDGTVEVIPVQFGNSAVFLSAVQNFIQGTSSPAIVDTDEATVPVYDSELMVFGPASGFPQSLFTSSVSTVLDLERPWGVNDIDTSRNFLVMTDNVNTRILCMDLGYNFAGDPYESFVERKNLHLVPNRDVEKISSIILEAEGDDDAELQVRIETVDAAGKSVDLTDTDNGLFQADFNIGEDYKVDLRKTGRFLAYRITDRGLQEKEWNVAMFALEIGKGGTR